VAQRYAITKEKDRSRVHFPTRGKTFYHVSIGSVKLYLYGQCGISSVCQMDEKSRHREKLSMNLLLILINVWFISAIDLHKYFTNSQVYDPRRNPFHPCSAPFYFSFLLSLALAYYPLLSVAYKKMSPV
jgi:hypothetical protein